MNFREIGDATLIGRVLLDESVYPHLEAFSKNALYCSWEMPTMGKYKTVKEVCALTGLTRKHLYYFHHEKVAQAVAYANYSVEGNDGYKLYDDVTVEKLQQIALYYQLGLRRDEIRDIMLAPDYDSNRILDSALAMQKEKKIHIDRSIAALEYLIRIGSKNSVNSLLRGMSLDDLGRILLVVYENDTRTPDLLPHRKSFEHEFKSLISAFGSLEDSLTKTGVGDEFVKRIVDLCTLYLGIDGVPFVLGLFMGALGEGAVAEDLIQKIKPHHARAVIQYIVDHPELQSQQGCSQTTANADSKEEKK